MNLYAGEPSKFLYGSDWPICSMKSYVEFVCQLKLSPADLEAISLRTRASCFPGGCWAWKVGARKASEEARVPVAQSRNQE